MDPTGTGIFYIDLKKKSEQSLSFPAESRSMVLKPDWKLFKILLVIKDIKLELFFPAT